MTDERIYDKLVELIKHNDLVNVTTKTLEYSIVSLRLRFKVYTGKIKIYYNNDLVEEIENTPEYMNLRDLLVSRYCDQRVEKIESAKKFLLTLGVGWCCTLLY